jgi:hypothetical protein
LGVTTIGGASREILRAEAVLLMTPLPKSHQGEKVRSTTYLEEGEQLRGKSKRA